MDIQDAVDGKCEKKKKKGVRGVDAVRTAMNNDWRLS